MLFLSLLIPLFACSSISQRVKKLNEYKTPIIPLDSTSFNLFTETPRNYTLLVFFTTTMKEHACSPCAQFLPEFELVAKGWKNSKVDGKLYFAVLDYPKASDVFQKFQVQSVPLIYRFPPTEGPNKESIAFDQYDTHAGCNIFGFNSSQIKIPRPIDYQKFLTPIVVIGTVALFFKVTFVDMKDHINFKNFSTFGIMIFSTIMCSGFMWNTIRNPPFLAKAPDGSASFMASGFSNQLGAEPFVISSIYGLISLGVLLLTEGVPALPLKNQRVFMYVSLFLFLLGYSILLFVFRTKIGQYPFKLFF
ncbi:hypothetical protein BC833DRAFT_522448 [Globomyces pollinis-pini]|nr:hypothetical protein BC833DRAFT_522448 [Globomyces pollinis-pini]